MDIIAAFIFCFFILIPMINIIYFRLKGSSNNVIQNAI